MAQGRENRRDVERMRRIEGYLDVAREFVRTRGRGSSVAEWPVVPGRYEVFDTDAPAAICTLSSNDLVAHVIGPGVAIAGRAYTPNLGIEKIVRNIISNPSIRFLVVCGRESPLFKVGQALASLCANGVDDARRIVGAEGPTAELVGLSTREIELFRLQVTFVDHVGVTDPRVVAEAVKRSVAANPGRSEHAAVVGSAPGAPPKVLTPGGRRKRIDMDRRGFFLVTIDRAKSEIELQHYATDKRLAHVVRAHSAESLWLSVLEEGLITQLSHAAYLGAELAKAEAALRLEISYEQDQPLRARRE